jgi:hypothetical protein
LISAIGALEPAHQAVDGLLEVADAVFHHTDQPRQTRLNGVTAGIK